MVQSKEQTMASWMDLSEAAEFLGVHFTTLRRWADAGKVPYIRTPGGRRRFNRAELAAFLNSLRRGDRRAITTVTEAEVLSSRGGLSVKRVDVSGEPWYDRLDEAQVSAMRNHGQRLLAILMQYASRSNGGEVFLEEGRRLANRYGMTCYEAGLSLVETVHAFVRVRRSIIDAVYQAGALAGSPDADTWRLYDRMNTFLDNMLLAMLEAYEQIDARLLEEGG